MKFVLANVEGLEAFWIFDAIVDHKAYHHAAGLLRKGANHASLAVFDLLESWCDDLGFKTWLDRFEVLIRGKIDDCLVFVLLQVGL